MVVMVVMVGVVVNYQLSVVGCRFENRCKGCGCIVRGTLTALREEEEVVMVVMVGVVVSCQLSVVGCRLACPLQAEGRHVCGNHLTWILPMGPPVPD
jgi:hypothetical protein